MQNLESTLLSQYANSPKLVALIEAINSEIDPLANINDFYNNVWNVETAMGWGLDVWGRIVGVTRYLQVPPPANQPYFGFNEASTRGTVETFTAGPFYAGPNATETISLSDNDFRYLIYAKALANIADGSIQSYNAILMTLFPGMGNVYVQNGNQTMTIVFPNPITPVQMAILQQSNVIVPPPGVSVTIVT